MKHVLGWITAKPEVMVNFSITSELATTRPEPGIDRLLSMIPVGYMAKRMPQSAEWLRTMKESLTLDVYSVSSCVNDDFADYVDDWKHNGWWFFDSPTVIRTMSREHSIDLSDALLFYYEVYEFEFENGEWRSFSPSEGIGNGQAGIATPANKRLDGYDVVTF